jgi:hypothetical protein
MNINKNKFSTAFSEKYQFNDDIYKLSFPASILIFGNPNSGKTHFLLNLLKDLMTKVDEIIIYLGAKDSANAFLNLPEKNNKCIIKILFNFKEDDLREYYKNLELSQLRLIKNNKPPKKIVLVADDIFGLPSFMKTSRTNPAIIEEMFANYRHINISIIITSQKFKQVIPSLRTMFKYCFITSLGGKDIKQMAEENETLTFNEKDIIDAYKKTRPDTKERGHLFFIDNMEEMDKFNHIHPDNSITIFEK